MWMSATASIRRSPITALARAIAAALDAGAGASPASIALILTDDAELAQLNVQHMGHPGPTDVLSFPLLPPSAFLAGAARRTRPARPAAGSISATSSSRSSERSSRPSMGRGGQTGDVRWSPADELRLLVTHGTLHICGWDHATPKDERAMRALEQRLLAASQRRGAVPGTIGTRPSRDEWPPSGGRVGRDSGRVVLSAGRAAQEMWEALKVVVGLGNPGERYAGTRHNVGWLVLDRLAERAGWSGRGRQRDASNVVMGRYDGLDLTLVKPLTWMNDSGLAVRKVLGARARATRRPARRCRRLRAAVRQAAVPGVAAAMAATTACARSSTSSGRRSSAGFRIGIGDPVRNARDHVLSRFEPDEVQRLDELLDAAADGVEAWAHEGTSKAANRFNTFQLREADVSLLAAPGEVDGPPDEQGIRRTRTGWRRVLPRRDRVAMGATMPDSTPPTLRGRRGSRAAHRRPGRCRLRGAPRAADRRRGRSTSTSRRSMPRSRTRAR